MKYIISWFERPQGSPIEYENAQANPRSIWTMEGARQFQDRVFRNTRWRVGSTC
jgi:hypothetical protein